MCPHRPRLRAGGPRNVSVVGGECVMRDKRLGSFRRGSFWRGGGPSLELHELRTRTRPALLCKKLALAASTVLADPRLPARNSAPPS